MWHRLFGQDVTLWGPTHLMLFGGAGLTLIGQAILLAEGMRSRGITHRHACATRGSLVTARRVGLMGGLLIGLSTFQGEFDFGVPQFRMVFHPMLIALAAGMALVAARHLDRQGRRAGRRGDVPRRARRARLIVGDGASARATPALPLYLVEALCVEAIALATGRDKPILLGVLGGLAVGTVGLAAEWLWIGDDLPAALERRHRPRGADRRADRRRRRRRARRAARRGPALPAAAPERRAPRDDRRASSRSPR